MSRLANVDGLNINSEVLDETWFPIKDGGKVVGIARNMLWNFARRGALNLAKERHYLEVALCPSGRLVTSKEALIRFGKRRNEWPQTDRQQQSPQAP